MTHFDPTETPPGFTPKDWAGICAQKARADIAKILACAFAVGVMVCAIMGEVGGMILSGLAAVASLAMGTVDLTERQAAALQSYLENHGG